MNAKEYREYLYRNGVHPVRYSASDSNRALVWVYLSIVPFLALEYFVELRYENLPSGVAFPFAHLLFWAFYFTYYQPGYLETKLNGEKKWEGFDVPTVLLGAVIWFVKVVVVELMDFVVRRLFLGVPSRKSTAKAKPDYSKYRNQEEAPKRASSNGQKSSAPSDLPRDIENALAILGLSGCRDWNLIHRRYRELAKKFHPDLNPEVTSVGNRFMLYDAAYRKLVNVKSKYFASQKQASG